MTTSASREFIRRRAIDRCEYCLLQQRYSAFTHHIEHIVAKQHGGSDWSQNLALACHRCNSSKGPNLTGIDPLNNEITPLFHPRRDLWDDHFRVMQLRIEGRTPTGRATVQVLDMNDARRLDLRHELFLRGGFP